MQVQSQSFTISQRKLILDTESNLDAKDGEEAGVMSDEFCQQMVVSVRLSSVHC